MPTLPSINPDRSTSGIVVDPRTLERVVPGTRRADGSVRKELKIRPGFTPQEDVSRFRGTRQADAEARALPKGHIMGWTPPSSSTQPKKAVASSTNTPLSKAALKNAKRKEKRKEKKDDDVVPVPDSWDEEEVQNSAPVTEDQKPAPKVTAGDGDEKSVEKLVDKIADMAVS